MLCKRTNPGPRRIRKLPRKAGSTKTISTEVLGLLTSVGASIAFEIMRSATYFFYLAVFTLLSPSHASKSQSPATCAVSVHQREDSRTLHLQPTQIDPKAIVSDACASYQTIDALNKKLAPAARDVAQKTDFFAYYRLNLFNRECPFWDDENSMCGNIACAVTTLDNEDDIPAVWRAEELSRLEGPKAEHPGRQMQKQRPLKPLQGKLGEDVGESCVVEYDDECDDRDYCVPEDEGAAAKGDYVSLVDNPERFTGYSGRGAQMVWEAIYRENCFQPGVALQQSAFKSAPVVGGGQAANELGSFFKEHGRHQPPSTDRIREDPLVYEDECLEKRVFFRIISGMHASIAAHLCHDYLNQTTGQWGPNLECYKERLHDHPERISNLYFDYALLVRAIGKIRNHLSNYTFCSGDPSQDRQTKKKVLTLADRAAAAPPIFDERTMFQDASDIQLKEDFRNRFRNVSRLMDCVGCDKCRLWGKVQTAGYGAALKILFEYDETKNGDNPALRRTELVALMNTFARLTASIGAIKDFRGMIGAEKALKETYEEFIKYDFDDEEEEEAYLARKSEGQLTMLEEIKEEIYLVWRTYLYVLRSWSQLPTKL